MEQSFGKRIAVLFRAYVAKHVLSRLDDLGKELEAVRAEVISAATIAELVRLEVERVVSLQPLPATGERGKQGDPGRDGKDGADGEPGRDAIDISPLAEVDESRAYPRGTVACYRGGVIFALRKTDPLMDDDLEKAGWRVCMNGVWGESQELEDDGRTFKRVTSYTDGRKFESRTTLSFPLYRNIWKEGAYKRGDVVTTGGSSWHCQEDTTDKPGASKAWAMMVKRGRDGRDYNDPKANKRDPVRLA